MDAELYNIAKKSIEEQYQSFSQELRKKRPFGRKKDIYTALEMRYKAYYQVRVPQVKKELSFSFADAYDGDGWYERQINRTNGRVWCWSGPEKTSILDFPLDTQQDTKITLEILRIAKVGLLKNMLIRVNHTLLSYQLEKKQDMMVCYIKVPLEVIKLSPGRLRLEIKLEDVAELEAPYRGSKIKAGIALGSIHIRPNF